MLTIACCVGRQERTDVIVTLLADTCVGVQGVDANGVRGTWAWHKQGALIWV